MAIRPQAGEALTLEGIGRSFGAFRALDNIHLRIEPGELVALLGPSGSGKTSLLRIIAGLEQPDQGRLLFGQRDAAGMDVQSRRVGFVFQHYALFKHMRVEDNIAFGLRVRPRSERPGAAEQRQRVQALLELVQLPGLGRRYPSQLSGGQRQRVALARALAIEPRVLLLDEPFGALDARVRKDLRRWLRELHARTGVTTVFVTHDQDEALELADRVVVMRGGRIEQVGRPGEVYARPRTPFVFDFLGEATRLGAEVRAGRLLLEGVEIGDGAGLAEGPQLLHLRPEDLALSDLPGPARVPVEVVERHVVGPRCRLQLRLPDSGTLVELETASAVTTAAQAAYLECRRWQTFAEAG